MLGTPQ